MYRCISRKWTPGLCCPPVAEAGRPSLSLSAALPVCSREAPTSRRNVRATLRTSALSAPEFGGPKGTPKAQRNPKGTPKEPQK